MAHDLPPRPFPLGIIGGGPAGLSLARFLKDEHGIDAIVLEKDNRVGGKSWTYENAGLVSELGTCYATRKDKFARNWMKKTGMKTAPLGKQTLDGEDFFDWAESVGNTPLPVEVGKYLWAARRLKNSVMRHPDAPDVRAEASMPILDWLNLRGFQKMQRLMQRAVTNMGYGDLRQTSALQATRWVDFDLLLSGRINDLQMPVQGWSKLWEHIADGLTVRLDSEVTRISRSSNAIHVDTEDETLRFDMIVCAIPLDDFANLTVPTESETFVNTHVRWRGYCTSLSAVDGWFKEERARMFKTGFLLGSPEGRLMSARYDAFEPELGGHIYMLAQLTGEYSPKELEEIALADVRLNGGQPGPIIVQKVWKYFAQYSPDGIRQGLVSRLNDMQGEQNTFYTGATFSHESVSHITAFNETLANQIAAKVRAAGNVS